MHLEQQGEKMLVSHTDRILNEVTKHQVNEKSTHTV
jgi:hypothetical protein